MTFEELKQQFMDNGFQIDGDRFIHERVDYSHQTIINGVVQPNVIRFEMIYLGEGCVGEDSDADDLFMFDIIGSNNMTAFTIGIGNFDDFSKVVG